MHNLRTTSSQSLLREQKGDTRTPHIRKETKYPQVEQTAVSAHSTESHKRPVWFCLHEVGDPHGRGLEGWDTKKPLLHKIIVNLHREPKDDHGHWQELTYISIPAIVGASVGVTVPKLANERSCLDDTGELNHLPSRNQSVKKEVCAELLANSP